MGKFWLKVWIGTKIIVFALVFFYILAFAIKNDKDATIWVSYNKTIPTTTLMLATVAFLAGVICTILARTIVVTLRQFRQVKERNRHEKLHRDVEEMKAKASLLQPRPPGDKNAET